MEIARDRSYLLLNSKEEYNRCLVPSIRMEGPSHPQRQAEVERSMDLGTVRLTREQEEEAVGQARANHKKKRGEDTNMKRQDAKKIRLDRYQEGGEGGEAEPGGGDGRGGGGGETSVVEHITHPVQSDIRRFLERFPAEPSPPPKPPADDITTNQNDDQDRSTMMTMMTGGGQMMMTIERSDDREQDDEQGRSKGNLRKNSDGSEPAPIASKSKLKNKITHTKEKFRPPTRTRVKAKRRIVDISKGGYQGHQIILQQYQWGGKGLNFQTLCNQPGRIIP